MFTSCASYRDSAENSFENVAICCATRRVTRNMLHGRSHDRILKTIYQKMDLRTFFQILCGLRCRYTLNYFDFLSRQLQWLFQKNLLVKHRSKFLNEPHARRRFRPKPKRLEVAENILEAVTKKSSFTSKNGQGC